MPATNTAYPKGSSEFADISIVDSVVQAKRRERIEIPNQCRIQYCRNSILALSRFEEV
jgi:hypothetical protein